MKLVYKFENDETLTTDLGDDFRVVGSVDFFTMLKTSKEKNSKVTLQTPNGNIERTMSDLKSIEIVL